MLNLESDQPGSPDKSGAPHATFDMGLNYHHRVAARLLLDVRAQVLNVFDTDYLYKFESSFGGTHFGQPRTFGLWISTDY